MLQKIQHTETTIKRKPLTPIESLLAEKKEIESKCSVKAKKINDTIDYIRENSSGLIISGLSSLLFSSGRYKNKHEKQAIALVDDNSQPQNITLQNNILAKKIPPLIWSMLKPMLIRWGIKKVKSMFFGSSK